MIEINIRDPIVSRVVRHASCSLNPYRAKLDGCTPYRVIQTRPHGGNVVELVERVDWNVPDPTQLKFEDPEAWLANADENLMADADGVHIARSIQCRPMQHRWKSRQKVEDLVGTPV